MKNIPVISFVGYSGSGKTSLIQKIIPELKSFSLRIAVIKHTCHEIELDLKAKDTWRYSQSGVESACIISKNKIMTIENQPHSLEYVILRTKNVDIILTEGFKYEKYPKIVVHRKVFGNSIPDKINNIIAFAADDLIRTEVPCFNINDYKSVARFIVQYIIQN